MQNILAVAKVIASLPERAKSPEPAKVSAPVHDCTTVDELFAADRAFFATADAKVNTRARLKAANKRVSSQLNRMDNSVNSVVTTATAAPRSRSCC